MNDVVPPASPAPEPIPAAAPPASTPAPPAPVSSADPTPTIPAQAGSTPLSVSGVVSAEQAALNSVVTALVTHANKPGASTSEFWAQFAAPPISFGIALVGSWAVAHGIAGDSVVATVVPPATAAVTGAVTSWLARMYSRSRGTLKAEMLLTARYLGVR